MKFVDKLNEKQDAFLFLSACKILLLSQNFYTLFYFKKIAVQSAE